MREQPITMQQYKQSSKERLAWWTYILSSLAIILILAAQTYLHLKTEKKLDQIHRLIQSQEHTNDLLQQQVTLLKSISNSTVGIAYIQQEMLQKAQADAPIKEEHAEN